MIDDGYNMSYDNVSIKKGIKLFLILIVLTANFIHIFLIGGDMSHTITFIKVYALPQPICTYIFGFDIRAVQLV
mgnify:FL=1